GKAGAFPAFKRFQGIPGWTEPVHSATTEMNSSKKGGKRRKFLLPQVELLQNALVTLVRRALEVVQKTAALGDHHQEAATGSVVLAVLLEMLGELRDALGQ